MELVERDSVALWWYNRAPRPALDLDSLAEPYVDVMREHYAGLDRELWVLDLTSDLGIPVFAAVSHRKDGPAQDILIGFGAHLDPHTAALRALTELNQFLPAVCERNPDGTTNYWMDDPERSLVADGDARERPVRPARAAAGPDPERRLRAARDRRPRRGRPPLRRAARRGRPRGDRPRPDPARHRALRRQGDGAGPAPLLAAARTRAALRRAAAARLDRRPPRRGRAQPALDLLLMATFRLCGLAPSTRTRKDPDRVEAAVVTTESMLRLREDAGVEQRPDGVPVLVEGHVRMALPGARRPSTRSAGAAPRTSCSRSPTATPTSCASSSCSRGSRRAAGSSAKLSPTGRRSRHSARSGTS